MIAPAVPRTTTLRTCAGGNEAQHIAMRSALSALNIRLMTPISATAPAKWRPSVGSKTIRALPYRLRSGSPPRRQRLDQTDHLGVGRCLRVTELGHPVSLGQPIQFNELANPLAAGQL